MEKVILGRTGMQVTRCSFGVLPMQRVSKDKAITILQRAYEEGINFYDTARGYTDSEEKVGAAFQGIRNNIYIASKVSGAANGEMVTQLIDQSLSKLQTDYIDLMQFHNSPYVPMPDGEDGLYDAMLKAKKEGKIRHIGLTAHLRDVAVQAVNSGFYETIQFPFSYISMEEDLNLVSLAKQNNVGFIAMKGLCGGMLTNASLAWKYIRGFSNAVPIWGIQHMHELEEFLELEKYQPQFTKEDMEIINKDRMELQGNFCRACGYCLPCPAEIPIPMAARMEYCLKRMPYEPFLTKEWQDNMRKIDNCIACGMCKKRCPYGIDTPVLLKKMYREYKDFTEKL